MAKNLHSRVTRAALAGAGVITGALATTTATAPSASALAVCLNSTVTSSLCLGAPMLPGLKVDLGSSSVAVPAAPGSVGSPPASDPASAGPPPPTADLVRSALPVPDPGPSGLPSPPSAGPEANMPRSGPDPLVDLAKPSGSAPATPATPATPAIRREANPAPVTIRNLAPPDVDPSPLVAPSAPKVTPPPRSAANAPLPHPSAGNAAQVITAGPAPVVAGSNSPLRPDGAAGTMASDLLQAAGPRLVESISQGPTKRLFESGISLIPGVSQVGWGLLGTAGAALAVFALFRLACGMRHNKVRS